MRSAIVAAGLLLAPAVFAAELEGRVELEGRSFPQAREGETFVPSAALDAEFFHEWEERRARVVGQFFARKDGEDTSRTHGDVRELYYQEVGADFEFRFGLRHVFWGVTEARHLVDIVNQSDLVEDLDGESKLGQPMFNLALIPDWGTVELFLMPYQRARTFPGVDGRPRLPLRVDVSDAQYESLRGQAHLDAALRYRGSFGPLDIGLAWFDGTARDPRILPCIRRGADGEFVKGSPDGPSCDILSTIVTPDDPLPPLTDVLQALGIVTSDEEGRAQAEREVRDNLVLVPHYDRLRQISVDAQYVYESLALKLEALMREREDGRSSAAVAGFEYTIGDFRGTGADLGLLAEYLWDERTDFFTARYDDDLFVGSRLGLNDEAGTQVLGGVIVERRGLGNRTYAVEASRRLGDSWRASLEARVFSDVPKDSIESFIADQDSYVLTLERFF